MAMIMQSMHSSELSQDRKQLICQWNQTVCALALYVRQSGRIRRYMVDVINKILVIIRLMVPRGMSRMTQLSCELRAKMRAKPDFMRDVLSSMFSVKQKHVLG